MFVVFFECDADWYTWRQISDLLLKGHLFVENCFFVSGPGGAGCWDGADFGRGIAGGTKAV